MTDIVERLRLIDPTLELRYAEDVTKLHEIGLWCNEAADEIERLRAALRDIACSCEDHCDDSPYGHGAITPNCCRNFARTALGDKE